MRRIPLLLIALTFAACSPSFSEINPPNAYDVVSILGLGAPSSELLPSPDLGEVVIRYGGWSLRELAKTAAGEQYLVLSNDLTGLDARWDSGIYRLKKGERPPAPVLASALLAYRIKNGIIDFSNDKDELLLMMADETTCRGRKHPAGLVGLYWSEDRLFVADDYCIVLGGGIWEAASE